MIIVYKKSGKQEKHNEPPTFRHTSSAEEVAEQCLHLAPVLEGTNVNKKSQAFGSFFGFFILSQK